MIDHVITPLAKKRIALATLPATAVLELSARAHFDHHCDRVAAGDNTRRGNNSRGSRAF
jgi:hypothetical protein